MTAELAIATPVLLLVLLTIVQFTLWSHATHVAQTAAAQGLAAARVQSGTAAAGESQARQTLRQLGDGPLADVVVDATRSTDQATVDVDGVATSVIPFLRLAVHAEAAGSVERFVPDGAR
ncbi:TadE/TadG family type IV pilus assembly protein [Actinophytocola sp.]|uniref:TadE/TadG family type IV pilus assembly protein n=1 Tax=Actinophytocola sp. TaxID=1872138 RepID=UPI003D6B908E